jgi:hypothetical protein
MFREFLFNTLQAHQPLTKQKQKELVHQLDELAKALQSKSKGLDRLRLGPIGKLDVAGARRAAQVAELYLDQGGGGISYRLPQILALVAVHPEEEFLPFWERITPSRARPRNQDTSAEGRAVLATSALLPMIVGGSSRAQALWLALLPQLKPQDQVRCLYWTLLVLKEKVPESLPPFLELAHRLSREEEALEVRFGLRAALAHLGEDVPHDVPGGVLVIHLNYLDFSCDIELSSESSLYDLHEQIQKALRWDSDHMWTFHLCSKKDASFSWPVDEYSFLYNLPLLIAPPSFLPLPGPEGQEPIDAKEEEPTRQGARGKYDENPYDDDEEDDEEEEDEDEPANALSLGQMGFKARDKFVYLFDFGDNHQMPLSVVNILDKAEKGAKYPRITGAKGKRPKQYRSWD